MLPASMPITRLSESQAAAQGLIPLVVTPPTPQPEPTPPPVPEPVPPPTPQLGGILVRAAQHRSVQGGAEARRCRPAGVGRRRPPARSSTIGPRPRSITPTSDPHQPSGRPWRVRGQRGLPARSCSSGQGWVRWSDPSKLTAATPYLHQRRQPALERAWLGRRGLGAEHQGGVQRHALALPLGRRHPGVADVIRRRRPMSG